MKLIMQIIFFLIINLFPALACAQGQEFSELNKARHNPEIVYRLRLVQSKNTDSIVQSLASRLIALRYLHIQTNDLTSFPFPMYALPKLDTIGLSDDVYPCAPLYKNFHNFHHLQCIFISTSNMRSFPNNLLKISSLHSLYINAPNIKKIKKQDIDFDNNIESLGLIFKKVKKMPGTIFKNPTLKELSISVRGFERGCFVDFTVMSNLTKLEVSTWENINFTSFFKNVDKNKIEFFCLRSRQSYSKIPQVVYSFKKLKKLEITIDNLAMIDSEIDQLSNLQEVLIFYKKKPSENDMSRLTKSLPDCEWKFMPNYE